MNTVVIVNRGGGAASADDGSLHHRIIKAFSTVGIAADVRMIASDSLRQTFEAIEEDKTTDVLVAGGGDGTISLAAGVAVRAGLTLGILPLGTLNHLARDAGIPPDLEAAAAVIAAGNVRRIDVAELNGRIFVNNSAVGLYPVMVRQREAQQRKLGRSKRLAMLIASIRALRHFGRYRLRIRVGGQEAPIRTPLLFVGNNRYETALFTLGHRSALDGGELCLYALLARTRRQLIGIALRGMVGTLDQMQDFVSLTGISEVEVEAERPMLSVSADGETLQVETPLHYRILPGALHLLMPLQEPQVSAR